MGAGGEDLVRVSEALPLKDGFSGSFGNGYYGYFDWRGMFDWRR